MKKIIGVVNDNTGEIYAYLDKYGCRFPHKAWLNADDIYVMKRTKDGKLIVCIEYGDLALIVKSDNYSFIYIKEQ